MNNPNMLSSLADKFPRVPTQGIQPLNLDAQVSPQPTQTIAGEGLSVTGLAPDLLKSRIKQYAYVAGYIMGSAPKTTVGVTRVKENKDDQVGKATIVAKQSKPSDMRYVLMALPRGYTRANKALAAPYVIESGKGLDIDENPNQEMSYHAFPKMVAQDYIAAFGCSIPEYAPHVSDRKEHWSPRDLVQMSSAVSSVTVRPRKTTDKDGNEVYTWDMKTTSPRRCLYTPKNIICLKAQAHRKIDCKTDTEAYEVNRSAFGRLATSTVKNGSLTKLAELIQHNPGLVWEQKYTVTGEDGVETEVSGIGSVYFMKGSNITTTAADGKEVIISKQVLQYLPWDATGSNKANATMRNLDSIVDLSIHTTKKGDKVLRATTVNLAKNSGHPMLTPYNNMIKYAETMGYITHDELVGMCSQSARASKVSKGEEKIQFMDAALQSLRAKSSDALAKALETDIMRAEMNRLNGTAAR